MLVTRINVTYECSKCKSNYSLHFAPSSQDLEDILNDIDRSKYCTTCGDFMLIKKAVFQTIEDEFGDGAFGEWVCQAHQSFTYYPIPLRRAVKNKNNPSLGLTMFDKYANIAKRGYPWKCPHCGQVMTYVDTSKSKNH